MRITCSLATAIGEATRPQPGDRLWASDHSGCIGVIRLGNGQSDDRLIFIDGEYRDNKLTIARPGERIPTEVLGLIAYFSGLDLEIDEGQDETGTNRWFTFRERTT